MKEHILGMSTDKALKVLQDANLQHRITREDENAYICTADYNSKRYNLQIDKGIVTEVTTG